MPHTSPKTASNIEVTFACFDPHPFVPGLEQILAFKLEIAGVLSAFGRTVIRSPVQSFSSVCGSVNSGSSVVSPERSFNWQKETKQVLLMVHKP